MDSLVLLFFILFFFWAILTIFEVTIISRMKVSTFKYINVEILSYFYYSLSIIIYFGILIYDFWKKKITKKNFIIYFLYFFIDITLIIALLHLIMILMSDFPSV